MLQICVQDLTVNVEVQDSTHFLIHSLWSIRLKWSNRCKQCAYVCWFTHYSLWLGLLLMQIDRKFKNTFYCTVSLKKKKKLVCWMHFVFQDVSVMSPVFLEGSLNLHVYYSWHTSLWLQCILTSPHIWSFYRQSNLILPFPLKAYNVLPVTTHWLSYRGV